MNLSIIEARARRNGLIKLAGSDYRDSNSTLLKNMIRNNKKVYLGIESSDGIYTVLGAEKVYFSTQAREEREIPNHQILEIFQKYGLDAGKSEIFDFLPTNREEQIWVKDGPTLCALWNLVLMLK